MDEKYSIEELNFAREVRSMAVSLRMNDMPKHLKHNLEITPEMNQWTTDHPISSYVPRAIMLIKEVADQIRSMDEIR